MPRAQKTLPLFTDSILAALYETDFVPAPEVQRIAEDLIDEIHSERWFTRPKIVYLFSADRPKASGRDATATCRKVGGIHAYLIGLTELQAGKVDPDDYNRRQYLESFPDREKYALPKDRHVHEGVPFYVITVHYDTWKHVLTDEQKTALVDHELMHVDVSLGDQDVSYKMRGHDTEEFIDIVHRHGAWEPGVQALVKAVRK
jgi:hypothetical protein